MNPTGVYVLLIEAYGTIDVGRLGELVFAGNYAYVGSAHGSAGLKRISRHMEVASGENQTRRWHIDYLLGLGKIEKVYFAETEENVECSLAEQLSLRAQMSHKGFGSSDCNCQTHLFKIELYKEDQIESSFRALGLESEITL